MSYSLDSMKHCGHSVSPPLAAGKQKLYTVLIVTERIINTGIIERFNYTCAVTLTIIVIYSDHYKAH